MEELSNDRLVRELEVNSHINSSGPNDGFVKLFGMIGGHNNDTAFLRCYTVKGIEKTRHPSVQRVQGKIERRRQSGELKPM